MKTELNLNQLWQLLKASDPWFANAYGEEPNPAWVASLKSLSASELLTGYKKYINSGSSNTLKLAEFKAMCKTEAKSAAKFPYQSRVYEPASEEQLQKGKAALDKIRGQLCQQK